MICLCGAALAAVASFAIVPLAAAAEPAPAPTPLASNELGDVRAGRETVQVGSSQTLTASNSGNTVTGQTIGSGAVDLQQNAFAGFDGIGNFVINTGQNNNLQGSISVNIGTTPPPR